MSTNVLSDRYAVLICLGSTVAMLWSTMWQQQRILDRFPDIKNQRPRFHAGVLSLFFSPTAGHVWFSLVFPWLAFILVDYWFFYGQITAIQFESQLLWTTHAFFCGVTLPSVTLLSTTGTRARASPTESSA